MISAGRAAWPELEVDDAVLREFVAARLDAARDRAADLVLACACTTGAPAALAAFSATYEDHIRAIIARTVSAEATRDEARQLLHTHLFVSEPGRPPRIASYSGRGDLLAFVRVTAVRVALGLVRKDRPTDDDEDLAAMPAAEADPELLYLKELYRGEFRAAFATATEALSPRERTLLRYHLIDGLSIDKLAVVLGVHRSTAARQLADARGALVEHTHRTLMARLKLDRGEVESILRLIESQVDLSVRRLL